MHWEGFGSLPVWTVCLSIRPSFPTLFFSLSPLLPFFSPSSSLSDCCFLLWPPLPILPFPSTLGATARTPRRPSSAKHIRRFTAWLLSQHRVSLGPPHTAYPHPGRSAGPSEAHLLLCPPSLVSPVCLSMLRELLESRRVGLPLAGGKESVGSWGNLVSLSLHSALPHPPQGLQPCASCIPELRLL